MSLHLLLTGQAAGSANQQWLVIANTTFDAAQGGGDIVPVRLKNAVLRILGRSKYRQYYLQQPAAATAGAAGGAAGPGTPPQGTPQYGGATPPHKDYSPFGRLPPAAQPSPQTTAFSHPGNMFGLMVRACFGSVLPSQTLLLACKACKQLL